MEELPKYVEDSKTSSNNDSEKYSNNKSDDDSQNSEASIKFTNATLAWPKLLDPFHQNIIEKRRKRSICFFNLCIGITLVLIITCWMKLSLFFLLNIMLKMINCLLLV